MKKAKRNAAIVISSSDDDEDFSVKSNFTLPKPKPKSESASASVPRKNPKRAKTAILSASCPRPSKKGSIFDEMKRFCEEFDEDFTGIKVSAGLQSNNDMWIDKYEPHFLEELAVQKKKVEEVKTWFEERLKDAMDGHSNVLLVAGPSGVGKTVNFNPVTVNSIKKTLAAICRKEQREVGADSIDLIAKASGGDIRHAINSLQYLCLKPHRRPILSSKERLDNVSCSDDAFCLPFGKDETLSLFHALGKFLHNKRESEHTIASDRDTFRLKEKFTRLPFKMDAPEVILCQAHGQAATLSDFLHENVLDFLSEEAIDDGWLVASYLSDADFLLSSLTGHLSRDFGAENIIQSAAASVAARGVLFGNAHPVPSRWHAIRRPKLWEVEQSSRRNKCQMFRQRGDLYNSLTISSQIVMATEFRPSLKWLGCRASESFQADNMVEDDSDSTCLHENKLDLSDDEIEDW